MDYNNECVKNCHTKKGFDEINKRRHWWEWVSEKGLRQYVKRGNDESILPTLVVAHGFV
jgi:hypothetical protein